MSITAILFAGQGAQSIGMGQSLYNQFDYVRSLYDQASEILGYDLTKICFTENKLINQTQYTQPAILVTSVAIYDVFRRELGIKPDVMAGFSLGEYTALYASGVFDFSQIINLIKERAFHMEKAACSIQGSMAAIIGLDKDCLQNLCNSIGDVFIANYNTPIQFVVSGKLSSIETLCLQAKTKGAKRAIPLNVSGAFHTKFMKPAADKIYELISELNYNTPEIDVIANYNAQKYDINKLASTLKLQTQSSVLWVDTINHLINDYKIDSFIEIGPGTVLSGFMKKIDNTKKTFSINTLDDINTLK